jgi:RPA family protein
VIETAERTLDRLEAFDDPNNEYAQMAREQYGDMVVKYQEATIRALEGLDDDGDESELTR